jgi:hypothetical protein
MALFYVKSCDFTGLKTKGSILINAFSAPNSLTVGAGSSVLHLCTNTSISLFNVDPPSASAVYFPLPVVHAQVVGVFPSTSSLAILVHRGAGIELMRLNAKENGMLVPIEEDPGEDLCFEGRRVTPMVISTGVIAIAVADPGGAVAGAPGHRWLAAAALHDDDITFISCEAEPSAAEGLPLVADDVKLSCVRHGVRGLLPAARASSLISLEKLVLRPLDGSGAELAVVYTTHSQSLEPIQ